MSRIIVTHTDGSTDVLTHVSSRVDEKARKITTAVATTDRRSASNASLTLNRDEVEIEDDSGTTVFRGILTDKTQDGNTVTLDIESFVFLAKTAEPTQGKLPTDGQTDQQIVRNAIDQVPGLSAGTVDVIEPDVNLVFHHATPALQIRLMRDLSTAYVSYNSDKTVDYEADIGSDKTATVIAPRNQNITESRLVKRGRKSGITHLRVIGGGSTHVDVVSSSYSSGDQQQWGRTVFQLVTDPTLLTRYGEALISELSTEWEEYAVTVPDASLNPHLGDVYTLDHPERGANSVKLEVAEVSTQRTRKGVRYELVLTNRPFARKQVFEEQAFQQSQNVMTGQTSATPNLPSLAIPQTEIPGGKYLQHITILQQGQELHLWRAVQEVANGDISLEIVTAPATSNPTVVYSQPISADERGSPLATVTAEDAARRVGFRINNTGSSSAVSGAEFYYTVETTRT